MSVHLNASNDFRSVQFSYTFGIIHSFSARNGLKIFVKQLFKENKKNTNNKWRSYFEISQRSIAKCHMCELRGSQFMSLHVVAS